VGRPKRHKPNDLKTIHDRRTTDKLKDAQLSPIEVDDPLEVGGTLIVMRSIRNDPLANLHARRSIDDAQYQGGRAFQHDFETAERGPRAIDPSKEAVDGGVMPEPITEAQQRAARQLALVHRELGANGSAIVYDVLIAHQTLEQVGARRQMTKELELKYLGRRFRECLDCLALVYGFAMEKR